MRILKLQLILLCLLLLGSNPLFSQTIRVDKPGKLSKQIKAASTVEKLQIEGTLNSDDWAFLSTCSNLKELDLSNAQFEEYDRTAKKVKYLQRGIFTIPTFEKLKILNLPTVYNDKSVIGVHILEGTLPNLQQLKMPARCTLTTTYPYGEFNIRKLEVTGKTNVFSRDKQDDKFTMYVDTLIIPTAQDIACNATKQVFPCVIIHKKAGKEWKVLNRWRDDFDISTLEQVDSLGFACFYESRMEKITIPSNIKTIPAQCFYKCTNLKEIDLGKVTTIEKYAFAVTNIEKLNIPESVTEIEDYAFSYSKIKQLEFQGQYPPIIFHTTEYNTRKNAEVYYGKDDLTFWRECEFIIPEGSRSTFAIGTWEKLALKEKGTKTNYTLTVEKAGELASIFPNTSLESIDSLTIKGFLYDTDFEIIKKCIHLRYLDISHCFVTMSPETLQKSEAEKQFLANYLAFVADAANQQSKEQYNNGQKKLGRHLVEQFEAMTLKTLAEDLQKEKIKPDPKCQLDKKALDGLHDLKEIRLPLQLANLPYCLAGMKFLEKVALPPALKSMGSSALSGCEKLKSIEIPATLQSLGEGAFKNCTSLEKIDLSNTTVEYIRNETFKGCINLKEVRLPETIKRIESRSITGDGPTKIKLYMKSRQSPPNFFIDDVEELHIPKGCKAGYQSSNYAKKTIDDM